MPRTRLPKGEASDPLLDHGKMLIAVPCWPRAASVALFERYARYTQPCRHCHSPPVRSLDALDVRRQASATARRMTMHGVARRSARRLDQLPRMIGNGSDCGKCS